MEVVIRYLDDGEATVTFVDKEEEILEVYLRKVPLRRVAVDNSLKPYDLSIFSESKNFNVVSLSKPQ